MLVAWWLVSTAIPPYYYRVIGNYIIEVGQVTTQTIHQSQHSRSTATATHTFITEFLCCEFNRTFLKTQPSVKNAPYVHNVYVDSSGCERILL